MNSQVGVSNSSNSLDHLQTFVIPMLINASTNIPRVTKDFVFKCLFLNVLQKIQMFKLSSSDHCFEFYLTSSNCQREKLVGVRVDSKQICIHQVDYICKQC